MVRPAALASVMWPRIARNASGTIGLRATEIDIGRPGPCHHLAQRVELVVDVEEVGHHLQHAGAAGADPFGDADEFGRRGGECRGVRTGRGLVIAGAAGGEAERPRLDALPGEFGHERDVFGCRVLVVRTALAHHVEPQRAVRHLRSDVDVVRPLVDGVEELGERVPVPLQALVERRSRDVFDALHQLDELAVVAVVDRERSRRHSCS